MNGDVPVARKLGDDFGNLGFCQAAFGVFAKQAYGIAYRKYRQALSRRHVDHEEYLVDNFMPFSGLDVHRLPHVPSQKLDRRTLGASRRARTHIIIAPFLLTWKPSRRGLACACSSAIAPNVEILQRNILSAGGVVHVVVPEDVGAGT
jgi:hypothetical protein